MDLVEYDAAPHAEVMRQLRARMAEGDEWARIAAASALAALRTDEALEVLWQELLARSRDQPHYLSIAIAQFGTRALDRLVALAGDDDPNLRYWAAWTLGATGEPRAVSVLERMAADDQETAPFIGLVADAAREAALTQERLAKARSLPNARERSITELEMEAVKAEGLGPFVEALSRLLYNGPVLAYLQDEHKRYWLYCAARRDPAHEDALLECLRLDPDEAMAGGLLWALLDKHDSIRRRELISSLPLARRERLEKRADDLDLRDECFRAQEQERDVGPLLPRLLAASNWVQSAVAEGCVSPLILGELTRNGRTKRIRRLASEALRRSNGPDHERARAVHTEP